MSETAPLPALPAAKHWLGDELLYWLFARWSLWTSFDRVWLQSHGPLPTPDGGPLILYLNHGSWWDGYMMYVIHRIVLRGRFDSYLLMEAQQLRSYRFFTWSGAFGIDRHDPDDTQRSLAYAVNLLQNSQRARALYIFPQGKIVPPDRRPLVTYPGLARIVASVGTVTLCPVALRYEFLGQQRPHAFIRIGPAHRAANPADAEQTQSDTTARLTAACEALREDVIAGRLATYSPILHGRPGIDQSFDAVQRRLKRRARRKRPQ